MEKEGGSDWREFIHFAALDFPKLWKDVKSTLEAAEADFIADEKGRVKCMFRVNFASSVPIIQLTRSLFSFG